MQRGEGECCTSTLGNVRQPLLPFILRRHLAVTQALEFRELGIICRGEGGGGSGERESEERVRGSACGCTYWPGPLSSGSHSSDSFLSVFKRGQLTRDERIL